MIIKDFCIGVDFGDSVLPVVVDVVNGLQVSAGPYDYRQWND